MANTASSAAPAARRPVNRATLYTFGAFGGILFGYDLGVIAGVLVLLAKQWSLTAFQKGAITASLSVGAMVGALLAGRLCNRIGRRLTIMAAAVVVIIGTIACVTAGGWQVMMLTRGVIGIGIGLSSATVPTYLAELAPARVRGALGSLNQLFIVTGILIAFLVDYALSSHNNWKGMFLGALIPAVILIVGLLVLPETPRWLLSQGRDAEARAVLAATLPAASEAELDAEVQDIRDIIRRDTEGRDRWRDLWQPWVRPMVLVAMVLAIGQQFSGVNAINAYFPTMLKSLGFATRTALLSAVLLGVVKFLFTVWELFMVDRWGRRPLLMTGAAVMTVALFFAGLVIKEVNPSHKGMLGTLTLLFLIIYLAGYELGWGATVWVMIGEIFPLRSRAAGTGLATTILWAATGLVTAVFPTMSDKKNLGIGGAMWVFAGINIVLLLLARFYIPETKGRSLEQIERDLRGGKLSANGAEPATGATGEPGEEAGLVSET
ncbi:sugar porter family MFS transporter [Catenulispora sp. NL8]|uniref:Sugar porter family MFS transporter n=1 Tax=Catenulispora pinistramenti TaxID=2705254 RepID=A0ABS5L4L8_9ACTN|nr:sugar porter family MFS transporter [Catenulispora pinistramenti]MBS2553254.1 sugar porter family MFS transporter [Catenulispora pinistramenti]